MSKTQDTTKAILRAVGYTPATLAIDLDISPYKAQRILKDGGTIYTSELYKITNITGMSATILCGSFRPGENRTNAANRVEAAV